jgi:hypothetical protein
MVSWIDSISRIVRCAWAYKMGSRFNDYCTWWAYNRWTGWCRSRISWFSHPWHSLQCRRKVELYSNNNGENIHNISFQRPLNFSEIRAGISRNKAVHTLCPLWCCPQKAKQERSWIDVTMSVNWLTAQDFSQSYQKANLCRSPHLRSDEYGDHQSKA